MWVLFTHAAPSASTKLFLIFLQAKEQVIELLPKMFRLGPTHRPLLKTVRALPLFRNKEPWKIFILGDMEDGSESSSDESDL